MDNLLKFIKSNKPIYVYGRSGTGKTTLLKTGLSKSTCDFLDDTKYFEDIGNFDISKVAFLEEYKQKEWSNAVEKSLAYDI